MNRLKHITLGLILAALVMPSGIASAHSAQNISEQSSLDWRSQQVQPTNSTVNQFAQNQSKNQPRRKISASRAKSAAMSRVRGAQFVNVQLVNQDTYRVRLQKNGQIIDVYVDAYTGRVKN